MMMRFIPSHPSFASHSQPSLVPLKAALINVTAAGLVVLTSIASAQSYKQAPQAGEETLPSRLARMESAIADLQNVVQAVEGPQPLYEEAPARPDDQAYEQKGADSKTGGNLSLRLDAIERGLQDLTGRIEQVAWQQNQNAQKIKTLTEAMALLRPSDTGSDSVTQGPADPADPSLPPPALGPPGLQGPSAGPRPVTRQLPAQVPAEDTLKVSAADAYDAAYTALVNGEYARAETLLKSFLVLHQDDPLAPEAQYNLGEIYLATGDNNAAASAFLHHVKNWPGNRRHIDAYTRLGTAFFRAGNKSQACGLLNSMSQKFPSMSAQQGERLLAARREAGC